MKHPLPLLASIVLALSPLDAARATAILQDQFDAIAQIAAFQPIGQSFIAEATQVQVAIAFGFEEVNPGSPNDSLEMSLYEGEGFAGPLLSTVTFSLPDGFTGFFEVDFSSVLLSMGAVYTAAVSVPTSSPFWGVQFSTSNVYPFGRLVTTNSTFYEIFCGSATNTQCADLRFRVQSATIPEPDLLSLLIAIVFASSLKLRWRRHPLG